MYLEQVFTQILKMSMTAGWCILAKGNSVGDID